MEIPVTLNVKSANVIPVINCMNGDTPTIICTIMNGDDTFIADPGEFDLCVCEAIRPNIRQYQLNVPLIAILLQYI